MHDKQREEWMYSSVKDKKLRSKKQKGVVWIHKPTSNKDVADQWTWKWKKIRLGNTQLDIDKRLNKNEWR